MIFQIHTQKLKGIIISPFCKLEYKLSNSDYSVISSWIVVYFSALKVGSDSSTMKLPLSARDTAFPFRICNTEFSLYIISNTLLKPVFSMNVLYSVLFSRLSKIAAGQMLLLLVFLSCKRGYKQISRWRICNSYHMALD